MGSGPVIITDDGGPPLATGAQRLSDFASLVRIGRAGERMDEITNENGRHMFDSGEILSVVVTQGDNKPKTFDDPDIVQVLGNLGSLLTVRINTAGDVELNNDTPLAANVDDASGFLRYAEGDSYISKVWVDGGIVVSGNGKPVRVDIDVA